MQIKKLLNILKYPIFLFLNLEAWLQLCKSFYGPRQKKINYLYSRVSTIFNNENLIFMLYHNVFFLAPIMLTLLFPNYW